jgi:hypothetical protein
MDPYSFEFLGLDPVVKKTRSLVEKRSIKYRISKDLFFVFILGKISPLPPPVLWPPMENQAVFYVLVIAPSPPLVQVMHSSL